MSKMQVICAVKGCRIVQLLWSDTLMRRAFFVLQPFLMDVWKLSFTHAAAIVNIWEGTSLMLPAVFQLLADKYLGNFVVVVISTASSTLVSPRVNLYHYKNINPILVCHLTLKI